MSSIEGSFSFTQSGTNDKGSLFLQIEPDGNLLNSVIDLGVNTPIAGTYDNNTHAVNFRPVPRAGGTVFHPEPTYTGFAMFDQYGNISALAGEWQQNGAAVSPLLPKEGAWYATAYTIV